jgi:transportin-3
MLVDALIYYHPKLITGGLCPQILNASTAALVLQQHEPVLATLHYLRDFLSYGTESPNSSALAGEAPIKGSPITPAQIQDTVKTIISSQGEEITRRVLIGMMFSFPSDCLQDASGVMLGLFQLMPRETAQWIKNTIDYLPPGSVKAGEGERLMGAVAQNLQTGELRKIRTMLQDFTSSYRRRNVAPRDGLGRLEATRFRLTG